MILTKYHKKDEPSFLIKKEGFEKIGIPSMTTDCLCYADENPVGYEDQRWIEKSKAIKARDNYTCQLCHAFNPSQNFVFIKQGCYDTLHHYSFDDGIYNITIKDYNLTITFAFSYGYHLVMPRLNVHHKIYYRNRNLWDYQDNSLVTLCEKCHHYIHSLEEINVPIVEEYHNGQNKLIGKLPNKPYQPSLDHTDLGTFHPFSLVKENKWGVGLSGLDLATFNTAMIENKKWYDYQEIFDNDIVQISYFICKNPRFNKHTEEELKKIADFIIFDFIENILGFIKINQ